MPLIYKCTCKTNPHNFDCPIAIFAEQQKEEIIEFKKYLKSPKKIYIGKL